MSSPKHDEADAEESFHNSTGMELFQYLSAVQNCKQIQQRIKSFSGVRFRRAVVSKHDFESLIQSFSLAISLRVISSTELQLRIQVSKQSGPDFEVNLGSRSLAILFESS